MAGQFTHDYKIYLGEDLRLKGEIEFNIDDTVSYLPNESYHLTLPQLTRINSLFQELKRIFKQEGRIRLIKISEK